MTNKWDALERVNMEIMKSAKAVVREERKDNVIEMPTRKRRLEEMYCKGEFAARPITIGEITLSRGQLSRMTGLSLTHVSRIFAGKRVPSLFGAKLIAVAFEVMLDDVYEKLAHVGEREEKLLRPGELEKRESERMKIKELDERKMTRALGK